MSKFKMDVIEVMGYLRGSEDGWGLGVMKMAWGDNPTTIDIRHMNLAQERPGKGVSLSDMEAEALFNILLREGFGTIEDLKEELERRDSLFEYGELVNENDIEEDTTIVVYDREGIPHSMGDELEWEN